MRREETKNARRKDRESKGGDKREETEIEEKKRQRKQE